MRGFLAHLQRLLMRAIGLRKLEASLGARCDGARADLAARLDAVLAEVAHHRAIGANEASRRFDALQSQLSSQGQADTERGDTAQNMMRDLGNQIDSLKLSLGDAEIITQAIGDLRGEIASLRADLAREVELANLNAYKG